MSPALLRFQLDVWREACRHLEIAESAERISHLLRHHVPFDWFLVRRVDPERSCLETVAAPAGSGQKAPSEAKTVCAPEEIDRIVRWCRQEQTLRHPIKVVQNLLPGLVPPGVQGTVLAGALNVESAPVGVLLLVHRHDYTFSVEQDECFRTLVEPFAVILENDRRLRELTMLREAVEADNRALLSRLGRNTISDTVVGAEGGLRSVMEQVELVARSDVPVLILGETGSGKEVLARAIHVRSRRAQGPILRVNCGAIPSELVDSELFGHERGSFTGAVEGRKGWFERADGGTLFLDECGELPAAAQVRLLRILQDGSFQRVGGEKQQTVDVRIVAATHRDLREMVAGKQFREDLWYRLAIFPIRLPPLRERQDDIPALAAHLALRAARRFGTLPLVPTPQDLRLLVAYPWPGNVRELAAVIERAVILGGGKRLDVGKALGPIETGPAPAVRARAEATPPATQTPLVCLNDAMARHIEAALSRTSGRIEGEDGAAKLLGINPHTLRARMRKLGVNWRRFRQTGTREGEA